ncbi:MAG: insulinase family protein [Beijerinckiaceae bacterium]|nr:insulinase family protein [Beijerinckiaceae bacterium]
MAAKTADWPQYKSDIPADPAVRFGKLANGLRYAVMKNATPKGLVSMRLRFDAGSLNESDEQQGLAHFLEHMAFRGSKRVPESEVWTGLQRLGMAAGADANASTSFTETIYKLDLPRNDQASIEAGFLRMRETASELTLDQKAMDAERGPILSEERLRASGSYRAYQARLRFLLPDHPGLSRFPIGKTDIIQNAPVSELRKFYDAFYRPERAVFVVVGDIDPDAIEAKIRSDFGGWSPLGENGRDPQPATVGPRQTSIDIFSEPTAPSFLMLSWLTPFVEQNTKALQKADVLDKIGFEILNRRLQALPNGPQHPFAGTGIQFSHEFNTANVRTQVFEIKPESWKPALKVAIREARRIVEFGVTKEEMDGVTADLRVLLQSEASKAGTRPSVAIASEIVNSVGEGEVYASRAESLSQFEDILKTLTPADINAALQQAMIGHGPLVFLSSPTPIEGGREAALTALREAESETIAEAKTEVVKTWPYANFGPEGRVAERSEVADLGTSFIRFENGVRLTVKPTDFQKEQVLISLRLGDGRISQPRDRKNAYWAIQRGAWIEGGLAALSYEEMKRALTGKVYGVRTGLNDDGLTLSGGTRPADIETQLQIFAAYLTAPGWRPEGMDSARTEQSNQFDQLASSPSGVFRRDLSLLLASGDQRWAYPDKAEIEATKTADLEALLSPQLKSAPIEIVVAGDVEVEAVIRAVSRTIGALPKRDEPRRPSDADLTVKFPPSNAEAPTTLNHGGRADQGIAMLAWPTTDLLSDTRRARKLRVMERIMQTRMTEQLRIQDGATYSPGTILRSSDVFPGYGFVATYAELPPAKMQLFFNVAESIAHDLKARDVTSDELDRAKQPRISALRNAEQNNGFWIETLSGAQTDPRRLDLIRTSIPEVESVTPADVRQMAATYLDDQKSWRLMIVAEPPAPPANK